MVLPLMVAGAGILGGASFLMGKYNERKAENSWDKLEQQYQGSSLFGTPGGEAVMQHARNQIDDAGFFDWAEGTPNSFIDLTGQSFVQKALADQQAQAANMARAEVDAIARGDHLAERWYQENSKEIDAQMATQGLLDVLERGDSASYAQSMLMWAQSMGMGALQGPDQKIVEGVGGVPSWFARAFNGLVDGTGKTWTKEDAEEIARSVTAAYNPRYERLQRAKGVYNDLWKKAQHRYQNINPAANVPTPFRYGSSPLDTEFDWKGGSGELPGPVTTPRDAVQSARDSAEATYDSVEAVLKAFPHLTPVN